MNHRLTLCNDNNKTTEKRNNKKGIHTCLDGKKKKLNNFWDAVKATPFNLSVSFSITHVPIINLDVTPNKKIPT
jgi:hypothetical protein